MIETTRHTRWPNPTRQPGVGLYYSAISYESVRFGGVCEH
jgi:hypothetical protein